MSRSPETIIENGLAIRNVCKHYEDFAALEDVSLHVAPGEFFTLLGPSGCGKTTLLRIIAGLELADSGQIFSGGKDITRLPAIKRQVNTVFQSYALFPHLTVWENVAFGLRSRKFPAGEIKRRVERRLEMLDLGALAGRQPHQLSGGQKQRVALARALVNEPDVLLLDEPMSALDARLRAQVQEDLRRLQRKLGRTFILVTHDQAEALVCSDRMAVMRDGQIVQTGDPEAVYDYPKNRFVAEFLGVANLIPCTRVPGGVQTAFGFLALEQEVPWEKGTVAIRPEWIRVGEHPPERNGVRVRVTDIVYRGTSFELWVEPGPLRVRTSSYRRINPGREIWLELAPEELQVLEDDTN
ncbi:spermidine/putrescine ABC transporter ATP-binding protein [Desulfosarcina widdelii]|uniref:Spermidine/putrescine ABC transporter ATP-binding protein n=1 Tax=Desulfosarcina widdelii TaxID=947919 RepID=A0A5K7Z5Y7_9BACT|nr:ABC transporter ATP-binding protein [Desulfosarcina widdelii]BBO75629.1 spermidine/putrescine ABC transporter ATP-binding protein [Desulfosarcina widdelii]